MIADQRSVNEAQWAIQQGEQEGWFELYKGLCESLAAAGAKKKVAQCNEAQEWEVLLSGPTSFQTSLYGDHALYQIFKCEKFGHESDGYWLIGWKDNQGLNDGTNYCHGWARSFCDPHVAAHDSFMALQDPGRERKCKWQSMEADRTADSFSHVQWSAEHDASVLCMDGSR